MKIIFLKSVTSLSLWLFLASSLPWHLQHIFLYCYSQMTLFLFCWNLPSNWKRVSTSSIANFSPSCINFYITCLFFSWMIHISNFFHISFSSTFRKIWLKSNQNLPFVSPFPASLIFACFILLELLHNYTSVLSSEVNKNSESCFSL